MISSIYFRPKILRWTYDFPIASPSSQDSVAYIFNVGSKPLPFQGVYIAEAIGGGGGGGGADTFYDYSGARGESGGYHTASLTFNTFPGSAIGKGGPGGAAGNNGGAGFVSYVSTLYVPGGSGGATGQGYPPNGYSASRTALPSNWPYNNVIGKGGDGGQFGGNPGTNGLPGAIRITLIG